MSTRVTGWMAIAVETAVAWTTEVHLTYDGRETGGNLSDLVEHVPRRETRWYDSTWGALTYRRTRGHDGLRDDS